MRKLYKITTAKNDVFYVVAVDPTKAENAVSRQWKSWDYMGKADAVKIELLAVADQFPPETGAVTRVPWLLEDKT